MKKAWSSHVAFLALAAACAGLFSCQSAEEKPAQKQEKAGPDPAVSAAIRLADSEKYSDREVARARLAGFGVKAAAEVAAELKARLSSGKLGAGFGILIDSLAAAGGPVASAALADLADDAKAPLNTRIEAVYGLRKAHDPDMLGRMARLCTDKGSAEVLRVAAIGAAGDFTSSKTACDLLALVMSTGSERERIEAARCLLCFDSFDIGAAFMARFFDPCWRVRMLAIEYVRRKPTSRGIEQVRITAKTDRNLKVAMTAGKTAEELAK